ncbi:hypothetical protein M758_7G025300 [Ceratodon purpureus]|nr:hypothetical protein M758_7G025300 [Ceratodon purpureus]
MAVATQCGTAVAPAIRVRDFVAKCSYSGGQRCCLVDVQKRFEGVGSRRGGVRSAPLKRSMRTRAMYVDDDNEDYLIDAPVSMGDGFSFSGGKYSDELGRADEWFARGKMVKAYPVEGGLEKAKDPLFGLAMGEASQTSTDSFRWFYVEEGDRKNPTVVLAHGFPSQAYSYRKVMAELSPDYHVVAFDWLGFGFSDKPQPKYGFNYTTDEYATALKLLVNALDLSNFTLAVQGYFVPAAVQFAKNNEDMVKQLILINPPITDRHQRLPSPLAAFSTFLLGEVFAQDPLKASDKPLTDCGPYILDEEDAMVYRRPYLTSGASGFALVALSRNLKNELKESVKATKEILSPTRWKKPVSIIWGLKDRWLDFNGVEDFAKSINARLVQLSQVGHHAQEDFGEEVGKSLKSLLKRVSVVSPS